MGDESNSARSPGGEPPVDERVMGMLHERLRHCQVSAVGTDLNLSALQLSELPLEVTTMFPSLRHLNLRNNGLTELPLDFARRFPHLITLNLSGNRLKKLPNHFGSLGHLQRLSLAHNCLQELPPTFSRLQALEELDLSDNNLEMLDDELGTQLMKLRTLRLANNPALREIPSSFGSSLTVLQVVDLSGNAGLVAVPDKIRRLHERNVIPHSRAKRRELITRALRVRHAVSQTMLNAAIVNPTPTFSGSKKSVAALPVK